MCVSRVLDFAAKSNIVTLGFLDSHDTELSLVTSNTWQQVTVCRFPEYLASRSRYLRLSYTIGMYVLSGAPVVVKAVDWWRKSREGRVLLPKQNY